MCFAKHPVTKEILSNLGVQVQRVSEARNLGICMDTLCFENYVLEVLL